MDSLPNKLYFLGLSGMGMAPLAIFLADRGHVVEGFDDHFRADVLALLNQSSVTIRNRPSEDIGMLVISRAVREEHELVQWARERSIPVLTRGEVLAKAVSEDRLIAVVGSHGKTTTTSLLIHLLNRSGLEFDYVLGGLFADGRTAPARGSCGGKGKPAWVLAEVDESDGTIDGFHPEVTLAVDWSWDHPDRYTSADLFDQTLWSLFERTKGSVWVPEDKQQTLGGLHVSVKAWRLTSGQLPDDFPLNGDFNERNAAAARSVAEELVGKWDPQWWNGFPGVVRRQQHLGTTSQWEVFQDYAHHPDELSGLFAAIRKRGYSEEPVVIFQPHRYSRTKQFVREFAQSLAGWKEVALLPVYGAGENLAMGVEVDALPEFFPQQCQPAVLRNAKELDEYMESRKVSAGKRAVWFVGAGDIESMAWHWLRRTRTLERWQAGTSPFSITVTDGELLGPKTTLGVGGAARWYAEPADRKELVTLLEEATRLGIKVYPLGRGSNLLVMDYGVDGLVIRLRKRGWEETEFLPDGRVRVGAGVPLKRLCGLATQQGMAGFEFLEGIPGSLGGALRMNAGAMGGWTLDVVEEVEMLTLQGELQSYTRDQLHAGYRSCQEVAAGIALSAVLRPSGRANSDEVRNRIQEYSEKRKESQPREPSAGCIFKNPEGGHAGALIDRFGLKGVRIGDAEISRVHGNFIVNRGRASSEEVIALIRLARKRIFEETGCLLEPEVLLWGADWSEVLG